MFENNVIIIAINLFICPIRFFFSINKITTKIRIDLLIHQKTMSSFRKDVTLKIR